MSTLTGSTKDFRPQPLGSTASVIITPFGAATSSAKSLLVSKPIRVTTASDGSFSVDLASYASTNPGTAYHVRVEWLDSGGNYLDGEDFPWPLVVTGDGALTDMFANVEAGKLLTKGEKGDDGDSVMQDAFDALEARLPQPGLKDRLRVMDLNGKAAIEVTETGDVNVADAVFRASEGLRFMDKSGYVAAEISTTGQTFIYDPAFSTGVGGASSTVDTLHVFLAAGQSNMSGRGLPVGGEVKDPRILQFGAVKRILEPGNGSAGHARRRVGPVPGLDVCGELLEDPAPERGRPYYPGGSRRHRLHDIHQHAHVDPGHRHGPSTRPSRAGHRPNPRGYRGRPCSRLHGHHQGHPLAPGRTERQHLASEL